MMLYNCMILPLFNYCDVVFGNLNVSHQDHIQKLQNYDAPANLGLDRYSHVSDNKMAKHQAKTGNSYCYSDIHVQDKKIN